MNPGEPLYSKQNTNDMNNSFPRINKLKIVGNGSNWSVASPGPFYLIEPENPLTKSIPEGADPPLTGATNLIQHFGLLTTYHKFCGKPLKPNLSSFLPNIAGNIDDPADKNQSGLLNLLQKAPITKDITPISNSLMIESFRLHNDPMPHLLHYFTQQSAQSAEGDANVTQNAEDMKLASNNKRFKNDRKRLRRSAMLIGSSVQPDPVITSQPINNLNNYSNIQTSAISSGPSPSNVPQNSTNHETIHNITSVSDPSHGATIRSAPGETKITISNNISSQGAQSPLTFKHKKSKKYEDGEKKKKKKKKDKKKIS